MSYNFVLHNNLHLTRRAPGISLWDFCKLIFVPGFPPAIRSDEDRASGVWHYMEFCVLWHLASLPVPGIPFPGLDQRPADTGKRVSTYIPLCVPETTDRPGPGPVPVASGISCVPFLFSKDCIWRAGFSWDHHHPRNEAPKKAYAENIRFKSWN